MLRSPLSVLAMTMALLSTAHADVYKFVDAQGHVQYTDKPQTLPAQRLNIQSQKTDTVAVQERTEAERKAQAQNSGKPKTAADQPGNQEEEPAANDAAGRCEKTRQRYETYMNSQRLYEALPNGERRYLSDAELDAQRSSAKVMMDEACKGL